MVVHDCRDQDVHQRRQVVLQQVDDFLQRLQGVQVDLGVGLLQPCLEGVENLRREQR